MKGVTTTQAPAPGPAPGAAGGRTRRVGLLILALLAVLLFMFGLAPLMGRLPHVRQLSRFIEERGIEANALYYTEIEEFAEAEVNLRATMDYPPAAAPPGP